MPELELSCPFSPPSGLKFTVLGLGPFVQMEHHLDHFLGNDLGGWRVRGCLCSLSQPEQSHGSRSENGKQIAHGLNRLQAAVFEQTARFENLVEILAEPSPFVPGNALPSILCRVDRNGGHQDPFQRFNAFRWLRLPYPY